MFNLIVKGVPREPNRDKIAVSRMMSYTSERISSVYAPSTGIRYDLLREFPTLFFQETHSSVESPHQQSGYSDRILNATPGGDGKVWIDSIVDRIKPMLDNMRKLSRFAIALVASTGATVAAAVSPGVPVLQVTAPNGQQSIMIASLHVPVDGLLEPSSSIFDGARHYAVEHEDPNLPPSAGSAEWSSSLTQSEVNTYLQRTTCLGLSEAAAVGSLREPTPHVANIYAYIICPLPLELSRDAYIASVVPPALATHHDVLEDANWAEMQRRKVPASVDLSGFRRTLSHNPKIVLEAIRDALNVGDYDSVREQTLDSLGSPDAALAFGKHMVDERNAAWLSRLRTLFDDGHAVVIVGAMHFPGPTGLIALLRREGYAVDAIEWPAARLGHHAAAHENLGPGTASGQRG